MLKIKKGDQVQVVAGKDKGKFGEVIKVLKKENAVIVKGANLYKKHVKPTQKQAGGIIPSERPLNLAKVALVENGKTTRIGFVTKGKEKLRISKKTGGTI